MHCTVLPLTLTTKQRRKLKFEVIVADTTDCCLIRRNAKYIGREVPAFRRNVPKMLFYNVLRKRLYLPKYTVLNPGRQKSTQMASLSDCWHYLQWIKGDRKNTEFKSACLWIRKSQNNLGRCKVTYLDSDIKNCLLRPEIKNSTFG